MIVWLLRVEIGLGAGPAEAELPGESRRTCWRSEPSGWAAGFPEVWKEAGEESSQGLPSLGGAVGRTKFHLPRWEPAQGLQANGCVGDTGSVQKEVLSHGG